MDFVLFLIIFMFSTFFLTRMASLLTIFLEDNEPKRQIITLCSETPE